MNDLFIKNVRNMISSSDRQPCYTGFLSEEEQDAASAVLKNAAVQYRFDGGIQNAQRKMLAVFCEADAPYLDFPYKILHIIMSGFDAKVQHREVLGSLLGLGVERDVVGDIIIDGESVYVAVTKEMSGYFCDQLDRIGKKACRTKLLPQDQIIVYEQKFSEKTILVSSNRLDCFVASITNGSRQKSVEYIRSGNVFINAREVTDTAKHLSAGDKLTVRRFGKYLLSEDPADCPLTSKGRIKIVLKKYE